MSGTREENVFMARLAETAERHGDMVEYMKRVAQMGSELSLDERNLLSIAYKNSVSARRQAWRASMVESDNPAFTALAKNYQALIEGELNGLCSDILDLLSRVLIPDASDGMSKVFYLKMKGDYYRYLAELHASEKRIEQCKNAFEAYQAASDISNAELDPVNPVSLGLVLNFSVFYNEFYGDPAKACQLATSAFEQASPRLDSLAPEDRAECAQILSLISSNLELWRLAVPEMKMEDM